MPSIIDKERDVRVREIIGQRFLRYRRDPAVTPGDVDVDVTSAWTITAPDGSCIDQTVATFRLFCGDCMGVDFAASGTSQIIFAISATAPSGEGFRRAVTADRITIEAASERGLLCGAMRLLHEFGMRRAPIVAIGERTCEPAFQPRIGNTVFLPAAQRLHDHEDQFPDDYLQLMAFFGINGLHVYLNFWDICESKQLPGLNAPAREGYLGDLRALIDRTKRFGIDVYLTVVSPFLDDDHPVFTASPSLRGAVGMMSEPHLGRNLCSSQPEVLVFYEEVFANLYRDVDNIGGMLFLVGGEGFMHCYTRPDPPYEGATNCSNCCDRNPSIDVSELMNRIAAAVKPIQPSTLVFCWPYSAFTWSGEDRAQLEMIANLSPDVELLSNLATGDAHPKTGANLFDYNIVQVEPSTRFMAQSAARAKQGKGHYAKVECTTTPMMFQLPMIPVPYRWAQRAIAMKGHGVAGYISHWRFFGFSGTLAEELLAASVWDDLDPDAFLEAYCRREYETFSPKILEGWRQLSDAWIHLPYSATLCGGRQYYMKGPIFTGPAHPFIFDVQNNYGLSRGFRAIRGDTREGFADEDEIKRLDETASPTYVSDLLWTLPVGVDEFIQMMREAVDAWDSGCELLRQALPASNEQAMLMLGLCEIVGIHFRTTYNLARFYHLRDLCFSAGGIQILRDEQFLQMQRILLDEIDNSKRALPILERDPCIGYGYCYGIVYDAIMVREKIDQCRFVVDKEIPELAKLLRFHLDQIYP
jgi:hypothetical protein